MASNQRFEELRNDIERSAREMVAKYSQEAPEMVRAFLAGFYITMQLAVIETLSKDSKMKLIAIATTMAENTDTMAASFDLFKESIKDADSEIKPDFYFGFVDPCIHGFDIEEKEGEEEGGLYIDLKDNHTHSALCGIFLVVFRIMQENVDVDTLLSFIHEDEPDNFSLSIQDPHSHFTWVKETYGYESYDLSGFYKEIDRINDDLKAGKGQEELNKAKEELLEIGAKADAILPLFVTTPLLTGCSNVEEEHSFAALLDEMQKDEKKKAGLNMMFSGGVLSLVFFPDIAYFKEMVSDREKLDSFFDFWNETMAGKEWVEFFGPLSNSEKKVAKYSFICGVYSNAVCQISGTDGVLGLKAGAAVGL